MLIITISLNLVSYLNARAQAASLDIDTLPTSILVELVVVLLVVAEFEVCTVGIAVIPRASKRLEAIMLATAKPKISISIQTPR